MLKRSLMSANASWASGFLLLACSGRYVKDVGEVPEPAGGGGGAPITEEAGRGGSGAMTELMGGGDTTSAPRPSGGGGGTDSALAGDRGGRPADEGAGGGAIIGLDASAICEGCTVDVLGPAEGELDPGKTTTVSTNVVDVTSDRVLREMEATLQIGRRTSAAWVVYEEVAGKYVLQVDQALKLDPLEGDVRSAPIDFPLLAGHRYAFGIYLNVGFCYESTAPESTEISLGHVAGAALSGGGDYHQTSEFVPIYGEQFAMRLYTSAPE